MTCRCHDDGFGFLIQIVHTVLIGTVSVVMA